MMNGKRRASKLTTAQADRLTVSLAPGQREALAAIAQKNNAPLAFVVRYALAQFIAQSQDNQLQLHFPGNAPNE